MMYEFPCEYHINQTSVVGCIIIMRHVKTNVNSEFLFLRTFFQDDTTIDVDLVSQFLRSVL